jgi:hypothetical protein
MWPGLHRENVHTWGTAALEGKAIPVLGERRFDRSAGGLAAVDVEDMAGDEGSFVRRDEDDRVGKVRAGQPARDAGQVWPEDPSFSSRRYATTVAGVALDQFINLRAPNRISPSGLFAQDEIVNLFVAFFRDGSRETRLELFLETLFVPVFPEINSG